MTSKERLEREYTLILLPTAIPQFAPPTKRRKKNNTFVSTIESYLYHKNFTDTPSDNCLADILMHKEIGKSKENETYQKAKKNH